MLVSYLNDVSTCILKGFKLVISDSHKGILEAISRAFSVLLLWHYYHVNLMKLILKKTMLYDADWCVPFFIWTVIKWNI